jgi:hypothetical protein
MKVIKYDAVNVKRYYDTRDLPENIKVLIFEEFSANTEGFYESGNVLNKLISRDSGEYYSIHPDIYNFFIEQGCEHGEDVLIYISLNEEEDDY